MIDWIEIKTPTGWRDSCGGHTPILLDPEKESAEDLEFALGEDCFQLTRGDMIIDVGWYPDGEANGQYVVQVVRQTEENWGWDDPLETFMTRSPYEVERFINEAGSRYMGS